MLELLDDLEATLGTDRVAAAAPIVPPGQAVPGKRRSWRAPLAIGIIALLAVLSGFILGNRLNGSDARDVPGAPAAGAITESPTPTLTATATATPTATATATDTATPTSTATDTATPTPTLTFTPTRRPTRRPPTLTFTPTVEAIVSPTAAAPTKHAPPPPRPPTIAPP